MKKIYFNYLLKGAFLGLFLTFTFTMLNAATLRHSYKFTDGAKDTPGVGVTAVDGLINGGTVANGVYTTSVNGNDYITFDGTALALNTYAGLTLEASFKASNGLNAGRNAFLSFFGGTWGNLFFMSNCRDVWGIGTTCYASANNINVEFKSAMKDDGQLHHMVAVLADNSLKFYLDGTLLDQNSAAPAVSGIGTENACLCKNPQSSDTWLGTIDEYNIYEGELTAQQIAANATKYLSGTGVRTVNQLNLSYSISNNNLVFQNSSNEALIAKVTIFNTLGKVQSSSEIGMGFTSVSLPKSAGIYIVELSGSGSKQTFKVAVK